MTERKYFWQQPAARSIGSNGFWSKLSFRNLKQKSLSTKDIKHWNSVAKLKYSASIITIQLKISIVYVSILFILAHTLFNCPCRRDPHMFLIHPLSQSSLAAHHTQRSILWLLICRLCVLCGPSFASHGSLCRELSWQTCLIDVLGGVSSAIVFLASVRWLRSPSLICPTYSMWIRMCQIHSTAGEMGRHGVLRISVAYEQ